MLGSDLLGPLAFYAPDTGGAGGGPAEGQEPTDADDGQEPSDTEDQDNGLPPDAMDAELRRARREAARYRTQLRKLQEAEDQRKRDQMTEAERLKADLQAAQEAAREAQAMARQRLVDAAVQRSAVVQGVRPEALEDLVRLIDTSALEVDEESGQIDGVDDAVKAFLANKPYYRAAKQTNINPTNPSGGPTQETAEQKRARLFGARSSPMFQGGGVVLDGQVVES